MMNQDDPISVIEKLIETNRDGEKGYKDAAEHIKRPDLKGLFYGTERRTWPLCQGVRDRVGAPRQNRKERVRICCWRNAQSLDRYESESWRRRSHYFGIR